VHVAALLYQILSLHSKIVMVKSHAELWSNITGLAASTVSNRSVDYVYCKGPQFSVECRILSQVAEFAHFHGIPYVFAEFSTGR